MKTVSKTCVHCKKEFLITEDDFVFYEKMQVLSPTHCPACRQIRRLSFRNFKTLYKRKSDKSGKEIISMYHEKESFPVYSVTEWWSDDWNVNQYQEELNFTEPFFMQFKRLLDKVPRIALVNTKSENCVYSNMTYEANNCYLVFGCVQNENCDYGHVVWNSRDCVDNLYIFKSEFCYECIDVLDSNSLFYSQECESCADSIGLYNCRSCVNCIGCVGLRNKSYCVFNQQVTKEQYKEFLEKYPLYKKESIDYILKERDILKTKIPTPHFYGSHNTNVTGNHIYFSKNVYNSFDIKSGEDSKFGYTVKKFTTSYDVTFTALIENSYEILNCQGSYILGSHIVIDSTFAYYSDSCFNCNNIFGCVGLRKKEYCVLNKQYTKEEYEKLLPKIIDHMKKNSEWGEFFPIALTSFSYNESIVNEYYPLNKDEALIQGFTWKDDIEIMRGQENAIVDDFTNNMDPEEILLKVFACENCKRNYRLIDREITFYKKFKLSLPKECFFCRHDRRMNSRSRRELFESTCDGCGISIQTAEDKKDGKKVFCEDCYRKEIV